MQIGLLGGREAPRFDPAWRGARRVELGDGAWVEHVTTWLRGDDALMEALAGSLAWEGQERWMYERKVVVPRLFGRARTAVPDVIASMREVLGHRYGVTFRSITFALYRDGRDSVAWHRDRVLRDEDEATVAIVSLGGPRPFGLRPFGGGASRMFSVGWGDLLVMGGTCQRTWEHCVPKVAHAEPRIAIMFRERVEPR